jgi:succinoglycan biosynthesis protein ExoM
LLKTVADAADRYQGAITVVIADDNRDGRARVVAERFQRDHPQHPVLYRYSASGNIAVARQTALDAALGTDATWIAFVDDDEVVPPHWLASLVDASTRLDCNAVTGPVYMTYPDGPKWLQEAPFGTLGIGFGEEGAEMLTSSTGNSLVAASFFRAHPELRFNPRFGETGGEDMMFFRTAVGLGLRVRFSYEVAVTQIMPPERCTLAYQLRAAWWLGTSASANDLDLQAASRPRLLARATRAAARSLTHPLGRLAAGEPVQLRFTLASLAHSLGMAAGSTGYRALHR